MSKSYIMLEAGGIETGVDEDFGPSEFTNPDAANENEGDDLGGDVDFSDDQFGTEDAPLLSNPDAPTNHMTRRYVKGAHLVYKRATEDGNFEEMWVYRLDDMKQGLQTRRAILNGTDIDPTTNQSADGSQYAESFIAGNAQIIRIVGLPN